MADEINMLDLRDLGQTGLRRYSGFVFEEFLAELVAWKGCAVYKEMSSNDPTISSMLFAVKMLCRRVEWRVNPVSSKGADLEPAEFLESCMDDMSTTWTDFIDEGLSKLEYGYSVHEIVYKRRQGRNIDPSRRSKYNDGRVGWRKLPIRSQDTIYRWQFDDHGGIQGVEQLAPPHFNHCFIPVEKMLLFRTSTVKNNPEGRSVLRGAFRPWYLKKNIENIEGIGVERDLAGLPVAWVPPELLSARASTEQKALLSSIKEIVTNIRRDEQEGVVFPKAYNAEGKEMYDLKLLSTGGQRQFDTDKIINRYDQRIAMQMLADFILMGQEKVGSLALSTNKTNLFSNAIGAFLDMMCDVLNRFAVPRLFALNSFPGMTGLPYFSHGDVDAVDLKELGDYIQKLAGAGMPLFPDVDLENYLRKVGSLPEIIEPPEKKLKAEVADSDPRTQVFIPSGEEEGSNPDAAGSIGPTTLDGIPSQAQIMDHEIGKNSAALLGGGKR